VAQALNTDIPGVSWALLIYQLAATGLALVFGRIGDIYGRERVYAAGYITFTLSSLLCGMSDSIFQLIAFRFFQGIGGAMTQSMGRALAAESVPENQAGKAQGFMTTAFHSGFLLGPTIGGLVIEYIHWRGVFFLLVPIGTLGAIMTFINMKRRKHEVRHQEIDYLGASLIVAASTSLVFSLDRRAKLFLGPELTTVNYIILLASFAGFLVRESRISYPIVRLSLFKIRLFTFSAVSLLVISIAQALTQFILPFYLQEVLELSPSFMGVLFMSAPIFTVSLAPVSGHVADRIGTRIPATAGVCFMVLSLLLGGILKTNSHWVLPALMLALTGLGAALFNSPNHAAMIGSVPREHRGFANGALQVMFNLGHILGISLGNMLMTVTFQFYTGDRTAVASPVQPAAFVAALNYTYVIASVIAGVAIVTSLLRGGKGVAQHAGH
jgi:EmrB/QacA subfamily drug resistance transporter